VSDPDGVKRLRVNTDDATGTGSRDSLQHRGGTERARLDGVRAHRLNGPRPGRAPSPSLGKGFVRPILINRMLNIANSHVHFVTNQAAGRGKPNLVARPKSHMPSAPCVETMRRDPALHPCWPSRPAARRSRLGQQAGSGRRHRRRTIGRRLRRRPVWPRSRSPVRDVKSGSKAYPSYVARSPQTSRAASAGKKGQGSLWRRWGPEPGLGKSAAAQ